MLQKFKHQALLLEQLFDLLIHLMNTDNGSFAFDSALDAIDKAGWCSDVADQRERQLQLREQAQIGLISLTRAKLIERDLKPDFTPNMRLFIQREIGSSTKFGRFLAQRSHAIRRCYLFLWCLCDRFANLRQKWRWLIGAGPVIVWVIGWRAHVISIEQITVAWVVLSWAALSVLVGRIFAK